MLDLRDCFIRNGHAVAHRHSESAFVDSIREEKVSLVVCAIDGGQGRDIAAELSRIFRHCGSIPVLLLLDDDVPDCVLSLNHEQGPLLDWAQSSKSDKELLTRAKILVARAKADRQNNVLRENAIRDPKTSLFTYGYLTECLKKECARTRRSKSPLSFLCIDLDDFKSVNDTTSADFGDRVLFEFGRILRETTRTTDTACRYGGDEFNVLLPDTNIEDAICAANRIMYAAERTPVESESFRHIIKLSIGISTFAGFGKTPGDIRREADKALRSAKKAGSGNISFFDSRTSSPSPLGTIRVNELDGESVDGGDLIRSGTLVLIRPQGRKQDNKIDTSCADKDWLEEIRKKIELEVHWDLGKGVVCEFFDDNTIILEFKDMPLDEVLLKVFSLKERLDEQIVFGVGEVDKAPAAPSDTHRVEAALTLAIETKHPICFWDNEDQCAIPFKGFR